MNAVSSKRGQKGKHYKNKGKKCVKIGRLWDTHRGKRVQKGGVGQQLKCTKKLKN